MADDEYIEEEEDFVDIDAINDERTLIELLDETEDFDERKRIRDRLRKVQFERKNQGAEILKKLENERENSIKKKLQEADEKKKRTLAMYDHMAKSKRLDVNIYKYNEEFDDSRTDISTLNDSSKKRDLVEEAIRQRLQEAENRKKRILAAYDHAAKSTPAGAPKIVNFDEFKRADVSSFKIPKTKESSCTFGMAGGIPVVTKGNVSTSATKFKNVPQVYEEHLDPMERAIRARQREAEERKRRTLAAYDIVARSGGAGPKVVVLEEFRDLKVSPKIQTLQKYDPTACFRAGVLQTTNAQK